MLELYVESMVSVSEADFVVDYETYSALCTWSIWLGEAAWSTGNDIKCLWSVLGVNPRWWCRSSSEKWSKPADNRRSEYRLSLQHKHQQLLRYWSNTNHMPVQPFSVWGMILIPAGDCSIQNPPQPHYTITHTRNVALSPYTLINQ
jgi:hypothetical protein